MKTNNSLSHRNQEPERSVLYIVGTPIGNLNDVSKRALNILKNVSMIACEDTRKTSSLLNYYEITNKLISFHEYSSLRKANFLISKLKEGSSVALVSDAGMPLISDPGFMLVKEAKKNNIDVICIPGPCAALAALISSGLDSSRFLFYGFLPREGKERVLLIKNINKSIVTSIVYESPKRIIKLLLELKNECGGLREIVVVKELTKKYEKHFGGNINDALMNIKKSEPKGEFTLVVSGNNKEDDANSEYDLKKDLINLISAGLSHKAASNYLAQKSGKSKNLIYKLLLKNQLK